MTTAVLPVDVPVPARRTHERVALAGLLVCTAALYLWNLSASGWANSFYSAAVQAGSEDWTAWLFCSSDAANAITVDKTPAALWVMGLSARIFGFGSWSVLAPQALMGVASVALLYATVRLVTGPAFEAAYLICAAAPLRTRLLRLAGGAAALVVSGGWYLLLVELWPAADRPYIGGSQHNSIVELALGYNGVSRLTGAQAGGLGNLNFDVGWDRLFGAGMGSEIGWLLPAAAICAGAGFVLTRRAPRTDPVRAALIIWTGWLVVTGVVFSYANGIVHSYYTV
ncbi:MAG: glycosyltransferase family 39 protein, partial [Mycobacterium sp.]